MKGRQEGNQVGGRQEGNQMEDKVHREWQEVGVVLVDRQVARRMGWEVAVRRTGVDLRAA